MRPTHPELLKLADEIDRLDKEIKESEKGVKTLNDSLDSLSGVIASVGLSRLVSEITNFTKAAIKAYGDMEALELGLQSVMGGAENAAIEMEKLKEVAKLPGLSFKEAVQGSVNLQSAGFSADMSRRALMAFGNALAIVGKGSAELGRVNLALTQLQNKTGGFGQDIRQLMEALPQ
ncbi:tape measure protein, partial [Elizabethkingia anophelis]